MPTEWPDLFAEGHWWANSEWTLAQLADRKALPLADPRVIRHGIPLDEFPARAATRAGAGSSMSGGSLSRRESTSRCAPWRNCRAPS